MQTEVISYYPPAIRQIQEIQQIAKAEDVEFEKLRVGMGSVSKNMYIMDADEQGISRFEAILGIMPAPGDTLETRRARVQARWMDAMPYNMGTLVRKMETLCGGRWFNIAVPRDGYGLWAEISISQDTEHLLQEVCGMLEEFVAVNMYFRVTGKARKAKKAGIYLGSAGVAYVKVKAGIRKEVR